MIERRLIDNPRTGFCHERVYDSTGWHAYQCSKKPLPGTTYCRIHSPEYAEEIRKKRNARWKAKDEARDFARAIDEAERDFLATARSLARFWAEYDDAGDPRKDNPNEHTIEENMLRAYRKLMQAEGRGGKVERD